MDVDSNAAPTTTSMPFSALFPLPFRVLFLVGLGILGWATNLHALDLIGIDAAATLHLDTRTRSPPQHARHLTGARTTDSQLQSLPEPRYTVAYRLFATYALWCASAWALFRYTTYPHVVFADVFRFIAAVCWLGILLVLICPFHVLEKSERDRFLRTAQRCILPPTGAPIHFSDVVFADIMTSFAKVIGDVWLSLCMFFPWNSLLVLPSQEGWPRWILPTIMSLPYLVRLRQCLIEHKLSSNDNSRHLYNAVKYATSFPVIFLSAAQRIADGAFVKQQGEVADTADIGWNPVFYVWLLAAIINSSYSFWWDVSEDWGLDLLRSTSGTRRHSLFAFISPRKSTPLPTSDPGPGFARHDALRAYPFGLRPKLLFPLPTYPLIVFFNFVLRMTWSIKLSSHLHSHVDGGRVIFWLEAAELVRRWLWVFIRVEWEVVKKTYRRGDVPLAKEEEGEEATFLLTERIQR